MMDFDQLWTQLTPVALLIIGVVFGWGWKALKDKVKATETLVDDAILAKIEEVFKKNDNSKSDII